MERIKFMPYQYINRTNPFDIVTAFRYNRYSSYFDTEVIPKVLPKSSYHFLQDGCNTLCFKGQEKGVEHLSWVIIHTNNELENLSHFDFKEKYRFL